LNSRYLIEVSYDGTDYNGWQKQPGQPTIQGEIEKALTILFRQPIVIMGSGRTDAGVHAKQQFAHFDVLDDIKSAKSDVLRSLRGLLPKDIMVKDILPKDPEFHARFDAISRQYIYQIAQSSNVFQNKYTWIVHTELDTSKINEAISLLKGELDFGTFSKNNPEVIHTKCTILDCTFEKEDESIYLFRIMANRFLHHMVRSLVGTLVEIGKNNVSISDFEDMLMNPDRSKSKFTAPPHALFLEKVFY
jgi:tRNA pseudouridine38-40 synthase